MEGMMFNIYCGMLSMAFVMSFVTLQVTGQSPQAQNASAYPFFPSPFFPQPAPTLPCSICPKLDAGFLQSRTRFESLNQKVDALQANLGGPCPTTTTSQVEVVVSTPSNSNNNAVTIAKCPLGTILINCRCSHEDASCDGVTVTGNKRFCKARNGPGGVPVRAIGMCLPLGDGWTVKSGNTPSSLPTLACDAGMRIADCWIENMRVENGLIRTNIATDGSLCSTTGMCGNGGLGCKLTVLCVPLITTTG